MTKVIANFFWVGNCFEAHTGQTCSTCSHVPNTAQLALLYVQQVISSPAWSFQTKLCLICTMGAGMMNTI